MPPRMQRKVDSPNRSQRTEAGANRHGNPVHHDGLGATPAFGTVCRFHAAQLQGLSLVPGERIFSAVAPVHSCTARR